MSLFKCEICNYSSQRKSNFIKHLNTKKHKNNIEVYGLEEEKSSNLPHKYHKKPHKFEKSPHKYHKKPHKTTQNFNPIKLICEYCDKEFTRKDSLNRHINKFCKIRKKNLEDIENIKIEHKKEKEKLYEYIEKLIEKSGDTNNINIETNTQNNNQINLNNFGSEDISHISDKFMQKLLSIPYGMVPKLIEKVHFSNKRPENKNIALTNKKEKFIKIFKNNKWKYKNREEIMDELINTNYTRLDDFYSEKGKEKLKDSHNKIYESFQDKFEGQDDILHKKIKEDCEMLLLSDNL